MTTHELARKLLESPEAQISPAGWVFPRELYKDAKGQPVTKQEFSLNDLQPGSIPVFTAPSFI